MCLHASSFDLCVRPGSMSPLASKLSPVGWCCMQGVELSCACSRARCVPAPPACAAAWLLHPLFARLWSNPAKARCRLQGVCLPQDAFDSWMDEIEVHGAQELQKHAARLRRPSSTKSCNRHTIHPSTVGSYLSGQFALRVGSGVEDRPRLDDYAGRIAGCPVGVVRGFLPRCGSEPHAFHSLLHPVASAGCRI